MEGSIGSNNLSNISSHNQRNVYLTLPSERSLKFYFRTENRLAKVTRTKVKDKWRSESTTVSKKSPSQTKKAISPKSRAAGLSLANQYKNSCAPWPRLINPVLDHLHTTNITSLGEPIDERNPCPCLHHGANLRLCHNTGRHIQSHLAQPAPRLRRMQQSTARHTLQRLLFSSAHGSVRRRRLQRSSWL